MEQKRIPKKSYAFIDGSFDPKSKIYGYGGFLVDQHGKRHYILGAGREPALIGLRNIAGEVLGARAAIELALHLHMHKLTVFHDYEGISAWPLGLWKTKSAIAKDYVRFVKKAIRHGLDELYFEQVKGHSGLWGNEEADQLAKLAIKLVKENDHHTVR